MNKSRLLNWVETAATVSVLIGLMVVALELRQSNRHATADSIREVYQAWSDVFRYESEYQIDLLLDKAVIGPSELTNAELYRLDDYYSLVMNAYMIREFMDSLGLEQIHPLSDEAPAIVDAHFYHPVAREWLFLNDGWIEHQAPKFHTALMNTLANTPMDGPSIWADEWRNNFASD